MMIFSVKVALFALALALPLSTFASAIVPKSLKSFTQRDLNDVKTNAERLARGMPLIAPRVPSPSRVKRNWPSSVPGGHVHHVEVCGRIAARAANSTLLGYVSQANSSVGNFGVTQNVSEALEVVFTIVKGAKSITSTSFELKNALEQPPHSHLAGIASVNATDFFANSSNFASIGAAFPTLPKEIPTNFTNSNANATSIPAFAEANIWNYNTTSTAITASWVNSDKSIPESSFVLSSSNFSIAFISLTGNATEYITDANLTDALSVTLELVPIQ